MTYEEAKKYFKRRMDIPIDDKIKDYERIAFDALEKQIPKKPTPYKGFEGKCTCCGVIFIDRSTNYCGNCGQALDWSDSE